MIGFGKFQLITALTVDTIEHNRLIRQDSSRKVVLFFLWALYDVPVDKDSSYDSYRVNRKATTLMKPSLRGPYRAYDVSYDN